MKIYNFRELTPGIFYATRHTIADIEKAFNNTGEFTYDCLLIVNGEAPFLTSVLVEFHGLHKEISPDLKKLTIGPKLIAES